MSRFSMELLNFLSLKKLLNLLRHSSILSLGKKTNGVSGFARLFKKNRLNARMMFRTMFFLLISPTFLASLLGVSECSD